jgi:hypothetical protein
MQEDFPLEQRIDAGSLTAHEVVAAIPVRVPPTPPAG